MNKTEIDTVIPEEIAVEWVNRWRSKSHVDFDLKGFHIPKEDMEGILADSQTQSIRGYFGIDELNHNHMIFVGVDKDGNDLIDYDSGYYIYDFTQPCPPMCSKTGPLK